MTDITGRREPGGVDGASATAPRLRVRVARLEPGRADDLLALAPRALGVSAWLGRRRGLLGWDAALRIPVGGATGIVDAARRWDDLRRAADVDAPAGAPAFPIAFASFGFAPATPGFLLVPRVLVSRDAAGAWVAVQSGDAPLGDPTAALDAERREPVRATRGAWTEPGRMGQTTWLEAVRRLVGQLRAGAASKVVLARDMLVSASLPLDERHLLRRLQQLYPSTWTFAVGGLVGATPEMLASRYDGRVSSRVLAGSAGPGQAGELLDSPKERTEHRLAVESVVRALRPLASDVRVPERPSVLDLPNVTHLATTIEAKVADVSALDVAAALHPTAAVCGTPTELARHLIEQFESTPRGRYSGPVGWIDRNGEGEFGIALRCGQILEGGRSIRLFAGAGIMPDSVPELELAETRAKMRPLLEALEV